MVTFVVATLVGAVGAAVQRDPNRLQALADQLASSIGSHLELGGRLPAVDDRSYPAPGYEEAGAPLGSAPAVDAASPSYTFLGTQVAEDAEPVAWSPCRPIHYVVDTAGAPGDFTEQLRAAIGEVSEATGLVFVEDGTTVEGADSHRDAFQPARYGDRWAPVLVRFADADMVADLAVAAGLTSTVAGQDPRTGTAYWVSGWVYLNSSLVSQPDADGVAAYYPILLHELGHLVGLDHVNDGAQLMYPTTGAALTYQEGDLNGLAVVGGGRCAPGV